MMVSIDTQEAFDKIRHSFVIKTLGKLGIEGNFFQLDKGQLIIFFMVTDGTFPPRTGNKGSMSTRMTLTQHRTESSRLHNKVRKGNKKQTDWKGRNKMSSQTTRVAVQKNPTNLPENF